jgi:hypothetical protein
MTSTNVQSKVPCIFKVKVVKGKSKKFNRSARIVATDVLRDDFDYKSHTSQKIDGTCCYVFNDQIWQKRERKLNKQGMKKKELLIAQLGMFQDNSTSKFPVGNFTDKDFKPVPDDWVQGLQSRPNEEMGHCIGWVPVTDDKADWRYHSALTPGVDTKQVLGTLAKVINVKSTGDYEILHIPLSQLNNQTMELIGPNFNGNPYNFPKNKKHYFIIHGSVPIKIPDDPGQIKEWLKNTGIEGVIWRTDSKNSTNYYKLHQHHVGGKWPVKNPLLDFSGIVEAEDQTRLM